MANINRFNWIIGNTDKQRYIDYCKSAVRDDDVFSKFRQNTFYRSVIGAPTINQAVLMYSELMKYNHIVDKIKDYIKLDFIGQPIVYNMHDAYISLNLIRYLDTLRLLHLNFGDLDKQNILEIGCGFGGLAYCIKTTYECNYYILDLAEAMSLQKKVNDTLDTSLITTACHDIDLLIAEYSISELDYTAQKFYFDSYISKSKKFMLRYNCTNIDTVRNFLNLLRSKFDVTITNEIGNDVSFNKILIGKQL